MPSTQRHLSSLTVVPQRIQRARAHFHSSVCPFFKTSGFGPSEVVKNALTALTRKIHEFRGTKGPAMVQNRCLCGFETKREAFA